MTAALRDRAKARLCDAFAAVPGDAPTLCEGWDAHDLAVHLWVLKHDPLSWPGDVLPPYRRISRERAARIKHRWSYGELVEQLRLDPGSILVMPTDALEGHRHALGEYVMHTLDVTRANGLPEQPSDPALDEALWRRVLVAARALHVISTPGLELRLPDGRSARIVPRWPGRRVVVTGTPTELMCWVYGRTDAADVEVQHPESR
ncbi:MAG: maleylpyruvate isomerase family mycothiol-dependent enzyme [Mobilicoccus sp.]|nr:maleylpyruvate isomerase family mycothiol-dependent enzyme [Mobilicoccus sp.]